MRPGWSCQGGPRRSGFRCSNKVAQRQILGHRSWPSTLKPLKTARVKPYVHERATRARNEHGLVQIAQEEEKPLDDAKLVSSKKGSEVASRPAKGTTPVLQQQPQDKEVQ